MRMDIVWKFELGVHSEIAAAAVHIVRISSLRSTRHIGVDSCSMKR